MRSDEFAQYCIKYGIQPQFTVPYHSYQNGRAERAIQLITEVARCSLLNSGLDRKWWPYAVEYAAHTVNRWPTTLLEKCISPYEYLTGFRPNYKFINLLVVHATFALMKAAQNWQKGISSVLGGRK